MMNMRTKAIAAATAAAIALTSAGSAPAFAAGRSQTDSETARTAPATEFSAGKRYRYYDRGHRNDAAAAAAFAAIVGGIAAYAAAREYRKARERDYDGRYGYGPHYGRYRHW